MKMRTSAGPVFLLFLIGGLLVLTGSCGTQEKRPAAGSRSGESTQTTAVADRRGEQAFLAYCAMCHGVWGEGDGPLASQLEREGGVQPAVLNDPVRLAELGKAQIVQIIRLGGGRTHRSNLMPPWGEKLQPEVIGQIADYVMALPDRKPGIPRATVEQYLQAHPGAPERGRKLFVFYCTMCHGPYGKGNGFLADTLWERHHVRPRDLTDSLYFAPKSDREMFVTVSLGGMYTGHSVYMPGWGVKLSPSEIKDVVTYVRAISKTRSRP